MHRVIFGSLGLALAGAASLLSMGCDPDFYYDRVNIDLKVVDSSDSLRREVESSELEVTLAAAPVVILLAPSSNSDPSDPNTPQPSQIQNFYTDPFPHAVVNPSGADSALLVYDSHALDSHGNWIDPEMATMNWNHVMPAKATVRFVYKRAGGAQYCTAQATDSPVTTHVTSGGSYLKTCKMGPQKDVYSICVEEQGEIHLQHLITHHLTLDLAGATCESAK